MNNIFKLGLVTLLMVTGLITGQLIKLPNTTQGGLTLLDLLVIILSLWGLFNLKFHLKKPPLWIITSTVFVFMALLSLALTPLHLSITQYGISFSYLIRFIIYILFGWIIYSGKFPTIRENAASIIIYSGLFLTVLGFGQLIIFPDLSIFSLNGWDPHYLRMVSTFLDPNFLGGFLSLSFLTLFLSPTTQIAPRPKIFFLALIYLAILLTFSRSAYLALGVTFTTLTLLQRSWKIFFLTVFISLGFTLGYLVYQQSVAQPHNIDRQQSAQYRVNSWQNGWKMFSSAPILGVGFNTYRYALDEYKLVPTSFTQSRGASANDSSLLFVLATTGILGLVAFLLFMGSLIRQNTLLFAGLTGIIAQSFFVNNLFYPWILIWIVLMTVKTK